MWCARTQYDKDENLKFFFMEKGAIAPMASQLPSASATSAASKSVVRRRAKPITKINWVQGELLGSGSCGQVYLSLNVDTGRLMAVKQVEHRRESMSNVNGVSHHDAHQTMPLGDPNICPAGRATAEGGTCGTKQRIFSLMKEMEVLKNLRHPNIVEYIGMVHEGNFTNVFLECVPGRGKGKRWNGEAFFFSRERARRPRPLS